VSALDGPLELGRSVARPLERTARKLARRRVNLSAGERYASSAAGAALALWGARGLSRGKFWGIPITMIGAGLVWRAVTGHDALYSALGIDRSGRKPVEVEPSFAAEPPSDEPTRG